jgi:hypothetical protein
MLNQLDTQRLVLNVEQLNGRGSLTVGGWNWEPCGMLFARSEREQWKQVCALADGVTLAPTRD